MAQIIKFELEKLCSRRIVWVGLLCLLFFNIATVWNSQACQYEVITLDGQMLSGGAGKQYIKERTEQYAGLLNDTKRDQILKTERAADIMDYAYLDSLPLYTAMEENFASQYGPFYGKSIDEVYTQNGITVEVGNTDRWTRIFYYFQQMVMVLGIIIVIAVSGCFSEEYTRGTDALLLTSRHGKRKCAQAKVAASLLFTAACYLGLLALNVIPFLLEDGLYGWDAGIQLDIINGLYNVPYTLNCGEAALIFLACGFLALLTMTAMTLLVSVWSRSSFIAIIVSSLLYFMPMFLGNVLPNDILCLTPIGASTTLALSLPKFHLVGLELFYQAKILFAAAAALLLAWVLAGRVFAKHQVA